MPDEIEDAHPNAGDGNGDGIPDSQQGNVASFPNAGGRYLTVLAGGTDEIKEAAAMDNPSPDDVPPGAEFPAGFLDFSITSTTGTSTVAIVLPEGVVANTFWKYGPTPERRDAHWYEFLFDGKTGAQLLGDVIVLNFVDGQRGDSDLAINGQIRDPGAPGFGPLIVAPSTVELAGSLAQSVPGGTFVGLAIVNPNDSSNDVSFTVLNSEGQFVSSIDLGEVLASKGQTAVLTRELTASSTLPTAMVVGGRDGPLQSFFLIGDNGQTRLDGVSGEFQLSDRLYFPTVRQGNGEHTSLFVLNPGAETDATFRLFAPSGELVGEVARLISRSGFVFSNIDELFGGGLLQQEGYVVVDSTDRLMGLELLEGPEDFYALAAQLPIERSRLLAPHFFVDDRGGSTQLRLLNMDPTESLVRAIVRAFDDDGSPIGEATALLPFANLIVADIGQFLGIVPQEETVTGYLELQLEPGSGSQQSNFEVLGTVTFAVGGTARAMLPLTSGGRAKTSFLQVAQSNELRFFTGLAILNAGTESSTVTVTAFDDSGQQTAEAEFALEPGSRTIGLLSETVFFGSQFVQVGGHLRVSASNPVVSFALFGDFDSKLLSAIEGQSTLP